MDNSDTLPEPEVDEWPEEEDWPEDEDNQIIEKEKPINFYTLTDIMQIKIPKLITQANELLCLDNNDMVLAILRHY